MSEAATAVLDSQPCAEPLEEIVNTSLQGVKFLATRLASRLPAHVDIEDLIQIGLVGLLQSATRFDPSRGVKFQTYANRRVEGAMLDYLRSLDWRPRSVRQRNRRLKRAITVLERTSDQAPGPESLACEIGIQLAELHEWMQDYPATGSPVAAQYSEDAWTTNYAEDLERFADPADSPESIAEKSQLCKLLAQAVDRLPQNQRMVLSLYYHEQLTMKEIGKLLGVKQARVSQLHSQAVQRLRHWLAKDRTQPGARRHLPPRRTPMAG